MASLLRLFEPKTRPCQLHPPCWALGPPGLPCPEALHSGAIILCEGAVWQCRCGAPVPSRRGRANGPRPLLASSSTQESFDA